MFLGPETNHFDKGEPFLDYLKSVEDLALVECQGEIFFLALGCAARGAQ